MLTKRQNFLETIKGGNPDRFVNQYEFLVMARGLDPISRQNPAVLPDGSPAGNVENNLFCRDFGHQLGDTGPDIIQNAAGRHEIA